MKMIIYREDHIEISNKIEEKLKSPKYEKDYLIEWLYSIKGDIEDMIDELEENLVDDDRYCEPSFYDFFVRNSNFS